MALAMTTPAAAAPAPSLAPNKETDRVLADVTPRLNPKRDGLIRQAASTTAPAPAPEIDDATPILASVNPVDPIANLAAAADLNDALDDALENAPQPPRPAPVTSAADRARLNTIRLAGRAPAPKALTPFFFAADIAPRERRGVALAGMTGDLPQAPRQDRIALRRGETMVDVLERAGVSRDDVNDAIAALGKKINLRSLRAGQDFDVLTVAPHRTVFQALADDAATARYLLAVDFEDPAGRRIRLRQRQGGFVAEIAKNDASATRIASISGVIDGSLYLSAKRLGAPDAVIGNLANIFAYDIDFQRDIFKGDAFEAVFELIYGPDGEPISAGEILFARMSWRGGKREKGYYRFVNKDGDGRADYYDADGNSAKRLLMKTPIDGARLSSGFGTRRHPVLGYRKAHKGVDFAAPRGTPIYAAGDGVIERMDRFGSFGNYVRIRHAQGYKTAYAHLKGFKRGLSKGRRVRQGDVIGYVGTTGRSTGPHLHYEVHHKGKAVNPQRLKIKTGVALALKNKDAFYASKDLIDARRPSLAPTPPAILAQDGERFEPRAGL